jgi:hypothetical protein
MPSFEIERGVPAQDFESDHRFLDFRGVALQCPFHDKAQKTFGAFCVVKRRAGQNPIELQAYPLGVHPGIPLW